MSDKSTDDDLPALGDDVFIIGADDIAAHEKLPPRQIRYLCDRGVYPHFRLGQLIATTPRLSRRWRDKLEADALKAAGLDPDKTAEAK